MDAYPINPNNYINGGISWAYAITSSTPAVPGNYDDYGAFNSANVSPTSFLPHSIKSLMEHEGENGYKH